jgi:hypothetical protein
VYVYGSVKDYGDGGYYRLNDFDLQSKEPPERWSRTEDEELWRLIRRPIP